jgi:transcriptional regulator with PAS, ATPase and Fis domain
MVRSASFGTLLLDEIGDLPMRSQAALLRVLQEGEVLPVGSTQAAKVDVRVIAATHMPIEELVERGTFRRDLYARLAGYTFHVPPLRERKVDLGLLVASLLAAGKVDAPPDVRLHPDATRALVSHSWPMNVRELEQSLRAACVLAEDGLVTVDDLPVAVASSLGAVEPTPEEAADERDEDLRRELLVRIVDAKGNVTEVARAMGKARQQIQRWLRRFQIDPEAYRGK